MKEKIHRKYATFVGKLTTKTLRHISKRTDKYASRILMFHDIYSSSKPVLDAYSTSAEALRQLLLYYKREGFDYVSLSRLTNERIDKGVCVVTFDDGFASVYDIVLPILREMGIPFTVFITTDFIGKPGYLDISKLKGLSKECLCDIGCHTKSHPMTRFIGKRELLNELSDCTDYLDKTIGKQNRHFAFPYGSSYAVSLSNIIYAMKCGFRSVSMTWQMPLNKLILRLGLPLPRFDAASLANKMNENVKWDVVE